MGRLYGETERTFALEFPAGGGSIGQWSGLLIAALFSVIATDVALAQSSFQGLTPGVSTKQDAMRALGAPIRAISATLEEYAAPQGMARVEVAIDAQGVVQRIEVYLAQPVTRRALAARFGLPDSASARQVSGGRLVEYYEGAALALTYATSDAADGVVSVGHLSLAPFGEASGLRTAAAPGPAVSGELEVLQQGRAGGSTAGCGLGVRWIEFEDGWTGVWTRRGDSAVFDAAWKGPSGQTAGAVMSASLAGTQVSVRRDQPGHGVCDYTGSLAADGVSVSGSYTCSWYPAGGSTLWRATIVCR